MLTSVHIKLLKSNAKLPTKGSKLAAGYDLYAALDGSVVIEPHSTVKIPLGFATEFSEEYEAMIVARSGISFKRNLAPINAPGIIDSDYRGEWAVLLHNYSNIPQEVQDGERIAQAIFHRIESPTMVEVKNLTETERDSGGFGSTGQ